MGPWRVRRRQCHSPGRRGLAEDALGRSSPCGLVERVLANVSYATGDIEAGLIEGERA